MAEKVIFIITSILLGVGLAMDAFSVSLANGMQEPSMKRRKMCGIAGVFAGFQALMPMIGWLCVHTVAQKFKAFEKLIHGIRGGEESEVVRKTGIAALLMQGIATSIDALSVGFTIADYGWLQALLCASIIAAVTFVICFAGLLLGRRIGSKIGGKAEILGGIILIGIGIEIFVSHMFF